MPKNNTLRIIIDTNLWISFLITDHQRRLDKLLILERIKFLFSKELLNEISVAGTKPKLKKYFSSNALQEMLLNMEDYIELVEVKSKINICIDIKDNFLLALAKDGSADFLLTGDKGLLTLKKYGKTEIVSISIFLEGMKQRK